MLPTTSREPKRKIETSLASKIFDVFNFLFLALIAFTTLYPFWDTAVTSFSSLRSYLATSFHIWPSEWSFEAYDYMLKQGDLWNSYLNTLFVTIVGTAINMIITAMAAYVLSKEGLKGQRIFMFLIVFTMLFQGGMIPTYIIVDTLYLTDSLWAMILPTAVNTYNLIVLRTFFFQNPVEIEESASIDGCSDVGIFFRIVLPISKPGLLTVTLYYVIAHWNDFMSGVLYIIDRKKWVLQLFLRSMLFESDAAYQSGGENLFLLGQPMKMAAVMMSLIPILLAYPFFQRYFTEGITAGAVKG